MIGWGNYRSDSLNGLELRECIEYYDARDSEDFELAVRIGELTWWEIEPEKTNDPYWILALVHLWLMYKRYPVESINDIAEWLGIEDFETNDDVLTKSAGYLAKINELFGCRIENIFNSAIDGGWMTEARIPFFEPKWFELDSERLGDIQSHLQELT